MAIFSAGAALVASLFTAGAAAVSSAIAGITIGSVAAFAARTVLMIGVSKLIAKRAMKSNQSGSPAAGGRVQTPPATNNMLPVVYGSAFIAPTIIDAKISSDQKYMWYVCALAEVTDTGGYGFGDIYYDGKRVVFDDTDATKVVKLITNSDPPQEDTKIAGKLFIYKFNDGSGSGVNTTQTAIQILSDSAIPENERWNGPIYTYTEGSTVYSPKMNNTAFMIVKMEYSTDAGTTNLGSLNVKLTNGLTRPGDVIRDYLTNTRYGCAIPLSRVDTASITALNSYSDELIDFNSIDGILETQVRYRIDGPVDPTQNCLANLQELVDACDSWLQYSEITGKWKVVINRSYTDTTILSNLFLVDSSNLIGGIDVNPIDLNSIYNQAEVQYPNKYILDQYDYQNLFMSDIAPEVLSPNEPINKLQIQLPQVNNAVQAKYLGARRLLQGREDLVINFTTDYSGIQVEAGDVIRVTLAEYGWDEKLFRVSGVQEQKDEVGNLFAQMSAFEYNDTVYADDPVNDYIPEANTGLTDPTIQDRPSRPIISENPPADGQIKSFKVESDVPDVGSILYMDYYWGTTTDGSTHKLYRRVSNSDGTPFVNGATTEINVNDFRSGTYYWSVVARTNNGGRRSDTSLPFTWQSGVTVYDPGTGNGGILPNNINSTLDVARRIGGTNFSIVGPQPTITQPVSVLSTTVRNLPVIVPGTTISSSYYYPWKQGTASSGGGTGGNKFYGANSTGAYTPWLAHALFIADGDDNWYNILYDDFAAGTVLATETYYISLGIMVVSDSPATVQFVIGKKDTITATYYTCQTDAMHTVELEANKPQVVDFSYNWTGDTAIIIGSAVFMRNITGGSNVTVVKGSLASSAGWNPYF